MFFNNGQKNRVFLAFAISIILHVALLIYSKNKENIIYIDSSIKAASSISLSFHNKIKPVEIKKEETKKSVSQKKIYHAVEQEVSPKTEEKTLIIPVVKDAKFVGRRDPPIYPKRALRNLQEGTVLVKALVDEDGNTKEIIIEESSGFHLLDKSALKAVSNWHFQPTEIDGKTTKSWIIVPVDFVIK